MKKIIYKKKFCQKNISKFKKHLKNTEWTEMYSCQDIGEKFSLFQQIVNTGLSLCCPEEICTAKYKNRYPWLTAALRLAITQKNNLSTESILDPTNIPLRKRYKKFRNTVTSLLRNAEIAYISKQLEINKTDLSKSWRIIKEITGLNNKPPSSSNFIVNNNIVTNKSIIVNEFNNFLLILAPV